MPEPVLAVGWDVGGWAGAKHGLAAFLWDGGKPRLLAAPEAPVQLRAPLGALTWQQFLCLIPGVSSLGVVPQRVVMAVDAPFGFPFGFLELLAHRPCVAWSRAGQLENAYAYRATDRHIAARFKTPLSGSFDKLGNNATVAMHHLCRWRQEGVRVLPFDEDDGCGAVALEVYPAIILDRKDGDRPAWFNSLVPTSLPSNRDAADAVICAALAMAWACPGRWGMPPLQGPVSALPAGEGWIYYPQNSGWRAPDVSARRS